MKEFVSVIQTASTNSNATGKWNKKSLKTFSK